jgi:hypothetical protein
LIHQLIAHLNRALRSPLKRGHFDNLKRRRLFTGGPRDTARRPSATALLRRWHGTAQIEHCVAYSRFSFWSQVLRSQVPRSQVPASKVQRILQTEDTLVEVGLRACQPQASTNCINSPVVPQVSRKLNQAAIANFRFLLPTPVAPS